MGKPKKGSKAHDEDVDDTDSTSVQMGQKVDDKAGDNTNVKKDKKKKKGKSKEDDDDWDDTESVTGKVDQKTVDNTAGGKKDKKKKKGKARDDDDSEDNESVTTKADQKAAGKMADNAATNKKDKKKKKGKANDDDDDSEEDVAPSGKIEKTGDSTAGGKKDKKKKKGKADDDDDEDDDDMGIKTKLKNLSLESGAAGKKNKETKKATKGMSAFQLLGELDDDETAGGRDQDSEDEDDEGGKEDIVLETVATESSKSKQQKKKKEKEKKKPKTADDDDIDAIMASLEEASTDKKKGKKNRKVEEEKSEEVEETVEPKVVTIDDLLDEDEGDYKKKRKNKGKKNAVVAEAEKEEEDGEEKKEDADEDEKDEEGGTVKSAAQKRKEKRDREKQKKQQEKQKQKGKKEGKEEDETAASKREDIGEEAKKGEASVEAGKSQEGPVLEEEGQADEGKDAEGKKTKKKKKKGEKEEGEKEEKSKPTNKKLALLKEHLKKIQEEELKAQEEMERQNQLEEERIRKYEEQKRLEEERKMKKKLKKKEREERLKKEGKFLTEKQKQDKRKLEQMLEAMKEAGAELPSKEEVPKKRPVYTKKKKTTAQGSGDVPEKSPSPTTPTSPTEGELPVSEMTVSAHEDALKETEVEVEVKDVEEAMEVAEVKDAWDAESEEEDEEDEDEEEEEPEPKPVVKAVVKPAVAVVKPAVAVVKQAVVAKKVEEEASDEEEEEDEESTEESESESEDELTPAEKGKEKVMKRIELANKEKSVENLRAPVVCVLGHVDTGKTKILDKLRRTNVQDGEAGGITQQIGATNVPKDAILDKTKMCKEFTKQELKLPGLLIIDTPGHESFSNLRVRGTSLCDIAILVVDIMHGLEPQTIESINLLKERKTPFLVALNKVDRLYQWKPQPMADVQNTVKKQSQHTKSEFDERAQQVVVQLAQEGLNAALFYENKNQKEYVSMVPTSAHTGDGMGNLVALICELCQTMLTKKLTYSPSLQAVVMEVKAITGMGTTIDVILINGSLNESDTIVLAGTEGPIVTQIRGLLMPQPMKELRVKNQYEHYKTVKAAQGVKVIAKDMEKALAGLPLYVAHDGDEKEYYKDEVAAVLKETLESIKVQERGVFVQASTLGSLEALLEFLKTSEIPYAGISIGPVHKKDIMKASVMLEHDSQYAAILAFDVKVERDAQDLADNLGVRIFTADIIYHLFDAFIKYRDDLKKKRQEEFKHVAVFPCKLRILPQFIFNSRDPIVMGVNVESGFVKEGTPICVPTKDFVDIGRVASIEMNHKAVDMAKAGQEICIKIMPIPGEAPKMYGRHFDETDFLVSKISRQSIDAVKDHFRDEMSKQDWKLMVELKKQFEIL